MKTTILRCVTLLLALTLFLGGCAQQPQEVQTEAPQVTTEAVQVATEPETTETPAEPALTALLENITMDDIEYYDCIEPGNFCVVSQDGKYGLMDYSGNVILPVEYTSIREGSMLGDRILFASDADENYYIVDSSGTLSPDPGGPGGGVEEKLYWYEDDYVSFSHETGISARGSEYFVYHPAIRKNYWKNYGVIPVQKIIGTKPLVGTAVDAVVESEKFALLDLETGKLLTDFLYEDFDNRHCFQQGLLGVRRDGKWGYVDKTGTEVIPCIYEDIIDTPWKEYALDKRNHAVVNGYIAVKLNGLWGLLNHEGNVVVDIAFEDISQVNAEGKVWIKENGVWTLYQLTQ